MRLVSLSSFAALAFAVSGASADRLLVMPLESPGHEAPMTEAERLSADLIQHGHRVVAAADAIARISTEHQPTGPDWAAERRASIDAARSQLTRLDRAGAASMARQIADELVHLGGGAGGAQVLVEWCLLERQLSLTTPDPKAANAWLDAAISYGPDVELDPSTHPDDERELWSQRRVALKSEPPASLSVATAPASAEVWIDGVRRCASPCTAALLPGRHLARVASPAYATTVIDVELAPGETASRRLGLTAAYPGASPRAIASMLTDPSRRSEGARALEPMARFLDVEHVIALVPEGNQIRVVVAPPVQGRSRVGPAVAPGDLWPSVAEQLRADAPPDEGRSFFKRPTTWIVGVGILAVIAGGILVYESSRSDKSGSITVR